MSAQAFGWVLDHSTTTGSERLVLISLANHARPDGTEAWPSIAQVAKEAGVHESTVKRCLRSLEERGFIQTEFNVGFPRRRADRRTNSYTVVMTVENPAVHGGASRSTGAHLESNGGASTLDHGGASGDRALSTSLKEEPSRERVREAPARPVPLPSGFVVSPKMEAWAREHAPAVDWHTQTDQFRDHHTAKGSTMRDWEAAWRTWMRNSQQWSRSTDGRRNGNGNGNRLDRQYDALQRKHEELLAREEAQDRALFGRP